MKDIKKQKGYILLFTILIVSLILAMALGISNVVTKEVVLTRATRGSHTSLFSADAGGECALYHYNATPNAFQSLLGSVDCLGQMLNVSLVPNYLGSGSLFKLDDMNTNNGCAKVTVLVKEDHPDGQPNHYRDLIRSKGYNMTCSELALAGSEFRATERLLEYSFDYFQGSSTGGTGTTGTVDGVELPTTGGSSTVVELPTTGGTSAEGSGALSRPE